MSISQLVSPALPVLRRYARALSGSQASGDAYVAATLEALIKDPRLILQTDEPKIELYRMFSRIWNSVSVNAGVEASELAAERRLTQISALPRQAFLLVSLEMFPEKDAAAILETDVTTLRSLVKECGRELADQIATDVLIIEDEALISLDLESLVESLGHTVLGVARTKNEAIGMASHRWPGLILADIQLADGSSGLDAVNDMLNTFEVPVIFITAYPERFLTGERPEPAFLITKPYQPAMVAAVVSQALFFERNASKKKRRAAV